MKTKRAARRWFLWIAVLILGATAVWQWLLDAPAPDLPANAYFVVKRGDMLISVMEEGALKSANEVVIRNSLEGSSKITRLVPEGSHVKQGDLLVELDTSELKERINSQEVAYQDSLFFYLQADQNLKIRKSQIESNIKAAELQVELSQTDLEKYRDGDAPKLISNAEGKIQIQEEELRISAERQMRTQQLFEKNNVSKSELEADTLSLKYRQIQLAQSKESLRLLKQYTVPNTIRRYESNLQKAKDELEQLKLRSASELAQAEADLKTSKNASDVTEAALNRLKKQLDNARIVSPKDGLILYASTSPFAGRSERGSEGLKMMIIGMGQVGFGGGFGDGRRGRSGDRDRWSRDGGSKGGSSSSGGSGQSFGSGSSSSSASSGGASQSSAFSSAAFSSGTSSMSGGGSTGGSEGSSGGESGARMSSGGSGASGGGSASRSSGSSMSSSGRTGTSGSYSSGSGSRSGSSGGSSRTPGIGRSSRSSSSSSTAGSSGTSSSSAMSSSSGGSATFGSSAFNSSYGASAYSTDPSSMMRSASSSSSSASPQFSSWATVVEEGAVVRERQELLKIPDLSQIMAEVKIQESRVRQVRPGMLAYVRVESVPGRRFPGRVRKVAILPDAQTRWMNPDLKLYSTELMLDGELPELKPGASARAEIIITNLQQVLSVPLQSVALLKDQQVCFVDRDGAVIAIPVTTGWFNDRFIEIKSGLNEHDRVLLAPPVEPEEGPEGDAVETALAQPSGLNGVPSAPPAPAPPNAFRPPVQR